MVGPDGYEHLAILGEGVEVWNEWRKTTQDTVLPYLEGAKLSGVNLAGANLRRAFLSSADLRSTDLTEAVLSGANLTGADLTGAKLGGANLMRAKIILARLIEADLAGADLSATCLLGSSLNHANLRRANLRFTHLHDVHLEGASLDEAVAGMTVFAHLDLSASEGLKTVRHEGPSSIDFDTILRSGGKIPKVFLQGCGLPDEFITHGASVAEERFAFHSCFISYSTKDQEFAQRLHGDLQSKGVRCWFAPEDLKIGDKFRVTIDENIRVHDKLLLVLSEHSVRSDWVEKEVETALEKEREKKRTMLFPIRLDDAVKEINNGWPADIRRTRHIGDFTKWKGDDAYKRAFNRLVKDLKSGGVIAR